MKAVTSFLSLFLLDLFLSAHALKIPFKRREVKNFVTLQGTRIGSLLAGAGDNKTDVGNIGNIRYTTTIKINGKDVNVALDTGSTDLWVIPPGGIGPFNDTGVPLSLLYGDGTYGVQGTIGVAPFEFGPYKVEKQAFLLANESSIGSMTELGIYGLFGLGFNDPQSSPINAKTIKMFGPDATWGASVLTNVFNQNPSQPNFIAVDLARTDDKESTAGGSFTISEYDDAYAAVASATKLSQYPPNGGRWTTLLSGIFVDGHAIEMASTIKGVPAGNTVALADTGSPTGIFSSDIMAGIYSRVSGAVYDSATKMWIVPCNATANVEFQLGGQKFALHPLDLTEVKWAVLSGQNYTVCTSSFASADNFGGDEFDLVLGDTFLRNVYSVFDFGDPTGNGTFGLPFMQFLSQTNPTKAAAELIDLRSKTLANMGPELAPAELLRLLKNSASANANASDDISDTDAGSSNKKGDVKLSANGSSDSATESAVEKYAPALIGLLAANLLVGLVLLGLGVYNCMRRGTPKDGKSRSVPVYVPVRVKEEIPTSAYHLPYPDGR